ncbi:MAG: phytanoyl-CoA dioxygenase family protein [Granulosicoccus sp.]|nr:phytanoyl-CoA dioxygenase family protein [Granulosicoccus sp.]
MSGLTGEQVTRFGQDGYLVVEDVFSQLADVQPVRDEYCLLLNDWCSRWIAEGKLAESVAALTFEEQLLAVYRAGIDYCQPLDISLPPGTIDADMPLHTGPAIFNLMRSEKLLDCVQSLIGAELTSNPIQHVRIKPPESLVNSTEVRSFITSTDWHQDRATTLAEADETKMVTAWVAITDATELNGCLQVIPGSHREAMQAHCPLPQLGIPDRLLKNRETRPLPVRSGGVVLFHPLTIHGSLSNRSTAIRWSFDLRYNVTGQPTGRPMFPSFVARSRLAPESELRDAQTWKQLWLDTRERLSGGAPVQIHRWNSESEVCA